MNMCAAASATMEVATCGFLLAAVRSMLYVECVLVSTNCAVSALWLLSFSQCKLGAVAIIISRIARIFNFFVV